MIFCRLGGWTTTLAAAVAAIALGSCSTSTARIVPSPQSAAAQAPMPGGPATFPYIAGTYIGTFKQTGGTGSQTGSITVKIRQYVSFLSGPIALKYPSHRARLTFLGILETRGKHLSFDMKLRWKSAHGRGNAAVAGSKISGTIAFPAQGSFPRTTIAFTAKKK